MITANRIWRGVGSSFEKQIIKSGQFLIRGLSIWRDRLSINPQIVASFPLASFLQYVVAYAWVHVLTSTDEYYGRESIDSIDSAPMSKQGHGISPPKVASSTLRTVRKEFRRSTRGPEH
jgi:hypothetical protein